MFAYLIQQRIEEPSFQLVFFDQAVRIMNELGLNSLTADKRFLLSSSSPSDKHIMTLNESDIDTPLCDLVICFNMATATFSPTRKPLTLTDIISARKQKRIKSSSSSSSSLISSSTSTLDSTLIGNQNVDKNISKRVNENRTELSNLEMGINLQLDDAWKGPLILPGPIKTEYMEHLIEESFFDSHSDTAVDDLEFEEERRSSVRFKYSTGWPELNISRLKTKQNSFQKSFEILQNIRIKSIEKVFYYYYYYYYYYCYIFQFYFYFFFLYLMNIKCMYVFTYLY